MRKTGLAFLCGMLLSAALACGPALAVANDPIATAQGDRSARDQAAAAGYLQIWIKAYGEASTGNSLAPDQPPLDILALVHGATALKDVAEACAKQALALKTMAALLDCTDDGAKTLVAAENLRDTKLFDGFLRPPSSSSWRGRRRRQDQPRRCGPGLWHLGRYFRPGPFLRVRRLSGPPGRGAAGRHAAL